jgi:hypothetical protein
MNNDDQNGDGSESNGFRPFVVAGILAAGAALLAVSIPLGLTVATGLAIAALSGKGSGDGGNGDGGSSAGVS